MAAIKCKMCGGELEIAEDLSICECEFCGTKQTIPKVKDENIQNLFNRANYLRMKAEFDKASEMYEKIIQSNEEEAEAYWGLILCKYGIEYVEDPATNKRIPTCHRASFDAVVVDEDYKLALKYADISQKAIYENEAKVIDEIQKGIVALAQREEPYDIFICYKETDADGKRTQDSVIANDIYYQLTQEGFKVFYAAITLEDKLGQEYEPYIFSALNSSKVMLTLGTKPEYFNAVWVKNEWSRFLKIMKKDRSRMLIPCYRDMDAYDLPEEFAHLQAQDMSKIGFINDLVRGIKKVVVKEEENSNISQQVVVQTGGNSSNIVALLERGTMALEDGEWEKADGFFEEVLNQDAKNGDAFLGKLLAENKCRDVEELKRKYIRKYKDTTQGETLEACDAKDEYIEKQAELYEVNGRYEKYDIIDQYDYDLSYKSYYRNRVNQKEIQMSEMEEDKLLNRCKQCCKNETKEKLDSFLNAVIEELEKRITEAKNEDEKTVERINKEYEEFIKKTDELVAEKNKKCKEELEEEYNQIITDMNKATIIHDYQMILKKLHELNGYKDSYNLIEQCNSEIEKIKENKRIEELEKKYNQLKGEMDKAISEYDYRDVINRLTELNGYKDSVELIRKCEEGIVSIKNNKRKRAIKKVILGVVSIVVVIIVIIVIQHKEKNKLYEKKLELEANKTKLYENAIELRNAGKYQEAYDKFVQLGDFNNSEEEAMNLRFSVGEVGEIVKFGKNMEYEFMIVTKEEDKVLLISKGCIYAKIFEYEKPLYPWEESDLRNYLNNKYYNQVFTETQMKSILVSKLENNDNPLFGTEGGNETEDKIFLLSVDEVKQYLIDKDRYEDSIWSGEFIKEEFVCSTGARIDSWVLRTPGDTENKLACISGAGEICYEGQYLGISAMGSYDIRPAFWVSIK